MNGVDWDKMIVDVSERYLEDDKGLFFVHNFTDVRAEMDVKFNNQKRENDTISFNANE